MARMELRRTATFELCLRAVDIQEPGFAQQR